MMKHVIAVVVLLAAGTASAQPAPQVYRLSPEEILRLQNTPAPSPNAFDAASPARPRDGKVHGEVGVGIGTGGYRDLYGVAELPFGDSGSAVLAFETQRFDYNRRGVRTFPVPVR